MPINKGGKIIDMRSGSSVLALLLLVLTASGAAAQSLGEIAKQEEARRKAIRSSGKVYTNGNLEAQPAPAPPPGAASAPRSSSRAVRVRQHARCIRAWRSVQCAGVEHAEN